MRILFIYIFLSIQLAFSQVDSSSSTSSSIRSPGAASGSNCPWDLSSNKTTLVDQNYQTALFSFTNSPCNTDTLILGGFNFSIPPNSTIKGIQATIIKRSDFSVSIEELLVQLKLKGTSIVSINKSSLNYWPTTTDMKSLYGDSTDTWNVNWNASTLKKDLELRLIVNGMTNQSGKCNIDYVSIKVYFIPGPTKQTNNPGNQNVIYPLYTNLPESRFMINGTGIATIADKYGKVIKKINLPNEWDGTDENGQIVNSGVYFIYINDKEYLVISVLK